MKILMVAPTPFFADRGCHVRILGEIQGLQELGHEVVVCTYPLGRDVAGVQIARTWPVPWYRKLSAGPSGHKYYMDFLLLGLVRKWIRTWQPDIVHAHLHEGAWVASWALGRRQIPLVFDYQGSLTDEVLAHSFTRRDSLQYRLLRRIESWVDRRADVVITSTGNAVDELVSSFQVPHDRVRSVTDGVDVDQFQPSQNGQAIRDRYRITPGTPLIVYTGLLNFYQGIDLFLESLSVLKRNRRGYHALLVGYPNIEAYQAKAKALGIEDCTTFTGRIPFEEVPQLLAASDIAVSAKLPGSEGNVKLYTYLSSGLPTVVFDTPINREIIADTGVLVPDVNASAFAEGLEQLLQSPNRWPTLGAAARKRAVEQFAWRSVAQRLVSVYDDVRSTTSQGNSVHG
jgi:glycosyltransferase involved in cell wall biosynthesis